MPEGRIPSYPNSIPQQSQISKLGVYPSSPPPGGLVLQQATDSTVQCDLSGHVDLSLSFGSVRLPSLNLVCCCRSEGQGPRGSSRSARETSLP